MWWQCNVYLEYRIKCFVNLDMVIKGPYLTSYCQFLISQFVFANTVIQKYVNAFFFLDILDSNNFRGHVKQLLGINEATVTVKLQVPLVLSPHLLMQNVQYLWGPQRLSYRYIESHYVFQDTAVASLSSSGDLQEIAMSSCYPCPLLQQWPWNLWMPKFSSVPSWGRWMSLSHNFFYIS